MNPADHPTLTLSVVRETAQKLAEKHPHRTVSSCKYAEKGKPSCIVGSILHELGWSISELEWLNMGDPFGRRQSDSTVRDLVNKNMLDIEDSASQYLDYMQLRQDSDVPWRRAVAEAEANLA